MRMRKKRHGNERLLALSALLYPNASETWENPAEVFGNDRPLKLEVGCGKGDFITALSERDTEFNYVALERVSDVAVCAVEKYAKHRGLGALGANGGWQTPDGELYKNGESWDLLSDLARHSEFGMTKEEMDAVMEPSLYTGRCAEQVERFLAEVRPLLADVSKSDTEINL